MRRSRISADDFHAHAPLTRRRRHTKDIFHFQYKISQFRSFLSADSIVSGRVLESEGIFLCE